MTVTPLHQYFIIDKKPPQWISRLPDPHLRLHRLRHEESTHRPVKHHENVRMRLPDFFPQLPCSRKPHLFTIHRNDRIDAWIISGSLLKSGIDDKRDLRANSFAAKDLKKWRKRNHVSKVEHVDNDDIFIF